MIPHLEPIAKKMNSDWIGLNSLKNPLIYFKLEIFKSQFEDTL